MIAHPSKMNHKIQQIKLLILDVDGVLTDGRIWLTPEGEEIKVFYIHDGYGIKRLQQAGIKVAIISGRSCQALITRLKELGIEDYYLSQENKLEAFQILLQKYQISPEQVAYIGDDLPDQPVMEQVGFRIAVPNAVKEIKSLADWTTSQAGGMGAVREVCDFLLSVHNS